MCHGCKHEASAIRAFEESMTKTHVNFKIVKGGLFIKNIPGYTLTQILYAHATAVVRVVGKSSVLIA